MEDSKSRRVPDREVTGKRGERSTHSITIVFIPIIIVIETKNDLDLLLNPQFCNTHNENVHLQT